MSGLALSGTGVSTSLGGVHHVAPIALSAASQVPTGLMYWLPVILTIGCIVASITVACLAARFLDHRRERSDLAKQTDLMMSEIDRILSDPVMTGQARRRVLQVHHCRPPSGPAPTQKHP